MNILDGREIRDKMQWELGEKIKNLTEYNPDARPALLIVQVGNRPESNVYIRQKIGFGQTIGAKVTHLRVPETVTEKELIAIINEAQVDSSIHGIIVQLPLPEHLNKDSILDSILPIKDVDGMSPENVKKLWAGDPSAIVPATARAVDKMLSTHKIDLEHKHVVIVGRSMLVGKPTFALMIERGATATICHSKTYDLKRYTKDADILISAVGKPGLITADHVRAGQIVLDVGISAVEENGDRHIKGDVDFDAVKDVVEAISPVPGGIGPLTVACLFENLVDSYIKQVNIGPSK